MRNFSDKEKKEIISTADDITDARLRRKVRAKLKKFVADRPVENFWRK